jgi:opacity protein-like surface antigen
MQALHKPLGFCLLLLLVLPPWVVSAQTDVLLPKHRGWHTGPQGWYVGLETGLSLFDDLIVEVEEAPSTSPPEGTIDLGPGIAMGGIVGYNLGALRFEQEVAWQWTRMDASISYEGMDIGVEGKISLLRWLFSGQFAFSLVPGSPHTAYVGLGLGTVNAKTEFEYPDGLADDGSDWAFLYELQAGLIYEFMEANGLKIGITVEGVESQLGVLFDSWFDFRVGRGSPHRAYVGGGLGAVEEVEDWTLAYQLGAGMVFQVAERTGFEVGYRFL